MGQIGNILPEVNMLGGSPIIKTRYTIAVANWSNSTDASGYYTYTLTLSTGLSLSFPPNIYIAGVDDSTFYTDTEQEAFALINYCALATSTSVTLYATTKPTVTFYIFIEGKVAA